MVQVKRVHVSAVVLSLHQRERHSKEIKIRGLKRQRINLQARKATTANDKWAV